MLYTATYYGEMVKMCWTDYTSWDNEPCPSQVCVPGWASVHAEGWTNQVHETLSGMAEQLLHLQLSLNSSDSGPLYSWLLYSWLLYTFIVLNRVSNAKRELENIDWGMDAGGSLGLYWPLAFPCWQHQHPCL